MRANLSKPWKAEEDETVLDLARRGLTIKSIALKLRRTPRAVKNRAGHLRKNAKSAHGERREAAPEGHWRVDENQSG
jgi:hypothetical protein